jgi:hypothetical protein
MDRQHVTKRVESYVAQLFDLLSTPAVSVAEVLSHRTSHDLPGVYAISDPADRSILYVGRTKTKSIAGRIADHKHIDTNSDLRGMLRRRPELPQDIDSYRVRYVVLDDDRERVFFEHFAIGAVAPDLNK